MMALLLAHMGTPFLAALVVLGMVIIAKNGVPDWTEANDASLDLTILSIGATGPLLLEPKLRRIFNPDMAVFGILLVLVNLLIACVLVGRKKWKTDHGLTFGNVWPDLLLGMFSVAMTTGAFYFAYNSSTAGGNIHA
jgi:hypothetical protein